MRNWVLLAASGLALLGLSEQARAAGPFECPVKPLNDAPLKAAGKLLPADGAFDQIASLNTAVSALRAQGMRTGLIVDSLIAAYCPHVASQTALNDAQKASRVTHFATRVAGIVYSSSADDEIILSVGFAPSEVSAIDAHAHSLGVSSDAWIQSVVGTALK